MDVGVIQGRKWGERDTYRELADLLDDPIELFAVVAGRALVDELDDFLLLELARERNPEGLRRLAEACEAANNGDRGPLDELMREVGVRPPDDLMGVADAAGVSSAEDALPDADVVDPEREQRNLDLLLRMAEASAAGPEEFEALAAEWGVSPEVLRHTPIDEVLDVVEAAQLVGDLEAWLRGQDGDR